MSNSLDLEQARQFVWPELGPNCLPRLSTDDTGRQRFNHENISTKILPLPLIQVEPLSLLAKNVH